MRKPTVIVTGGSKGIGLAIAKSLSDAGHHVVAVARRPTDQLQAAIDEAGRSGKGMLAFLPADLGDIASIPMFVRNLRKDFDPIVGLVNNAGVGPSGLLATMPDSQIAGLIQLNVLSPIVLTKYVVRAMMAHGQGRIVNISSIVGSTGYKGLAPYGATKSAMIGFTRSLAREVGRLGITVNAVAPGFINTEMTSELGDAHRAKIARRSALKRMAEVDDVAGAVTYLLSDAARNVTGTVLTVDAGGTA
jgi:3-oxoacyl-[acyl-carrier protein] reductase